MGGCVCILCKYYAILYKGLERVDSDSEGSRTNPLGIPQVTVCCQEGVSWGTGRDQGIDIRAEWATCMRMSASIGNSKSKATKQARLVCLRGLAERPVWLEQNGWQRKWEEMRAGDMGQPRALRCITFYKLCYRLWLFLWMKRLSLCGLGNKLYVLIYY